MFVDSSNCFSLFKVFDASYGVKLIKQKTKFPNQEGFRMFSPSTYMGAMKGLGFVAIVAGSKLFISHTN